MAELTWAVGELAELSTADFDVDKLLRRLCEVAAHSLPVDGVGVMKTGPGTTNRFVHASDPPLQGLEQLQETLQEGPCRDAVDSGQMVTAVSVADMRWPAFADSASRIGIRAVLAVPMISRGHTFGILDLYWRTEHIVSDDDRAAAQLLANVAVSYLSMAQDRAETRAARDQLAQQVLHDQLTGLPHRALMEALVAHALAVAVRTGTLVAVMFVDLDRFKDINDTHGHQAGDDVLQIVARRMQDAVRTADTVGRISGDEFIVSCAGIKFTDGESLDAILDALTAVGRRVSNHIAEPIELRRTGAVITITASIGIAVTTVQPTAAELIHTADQAMYLAKAAGRNRVAALRHP